MLRDWSDEEFTELWMSSVSVAAALRGVGLVPAGGNYETVKFRAAELGLNQDHMLGQAANAGHRHTGGTRETPLSEILVEGKLHSSSHLRKRLVKEGLLEEKCSRCGITEWMGQPAPLELDHINGIKSDNRLENLRILCSNCHSQTPTFRGRNVARAGLAQRRRSSLKMSGPKGLRGSNPLPGTRCVLCFEACPPSHYWHRDCLRCIDCGKPTRELRCRACNNSLPKPKKIDWPSDEDLRKFLAESSYTALARKLGVSDNAIRKHLAAR